MLEELLFLLDELLFLLEELLLVTELLLFLLDELLLLLEDELPEELEDEGLDAVSAGSGEWSRFGPGIPPKPVPLQ